MKRNWQKFLREVPKSKVRNLCRRCGWCCIAQSLFVRYRGRKVIDKDTMICRFLKFENVEGEALAKCEFFDDPKRPSKCKRFYCQDCVEIFHDGKWGSLMELTDGVMPIYPYPNLRFYPKLTTSKWLEVRDRLRSLGK